MVSDLAKQFGLDSDGYPTELMLEAISKWSLEDDFIVLMGSLRPYWQYNSFKKKEIFDFGVKKIEYRLATCGWSGNESIIEALRENPTFWCLFWESSSRGGLHVFHLPVEKGEDA